MASSDQFQPAPITRREDFREILHGVEVPDPYRWLEDGAAPETRAWLSAQHEYARPYLDTPGREAIRKRLVELARIDTVSVPIERGESHFFSRRRADDQQAVICLRRGSDGVDEVLIDPRSINPDLTISVDILAVSNDGSILAYSVRRGGEDQIEVRVMDVESRRHLPDLLPRARQGLCSWKPDKSGFYYTVSLDEGTRLRFHRLGTDVAGDQEIFRTVPGQSVLGYETHDGRYLIIQVSYGSAADRTELYFQDLNFDGPIVPIVNDIDATFVASPADGALFVVTNWKAPNLRVLRVDLKSPSREKWQEIIPESTTSIRYFAAIGGKLFATYLHDVHSWVRVFEPDGTVLRDLEVPGTGTVYWFWGRWDGASAFFQFSSFDHAPSIYRYEVASDALQIWWSAHVPADFDRFEVTQVWFRSKDGTRVPMFLFHRRDLELDGARPTLLTGYGGFNVSITPYYWPSAVAWVEAGGVVAFANLRGGAEFGDAWHRGGQRENKQNVFDDFIAAAEWLIANLYSQPAKLAIAGGSNGGLLVGAALTQRPDLYCAVICNVPILDMLRVENSLSGKFWISEYGSIKDPDDFRNLFAYSPYHNVRAGTRYPAVMFVTGDSDTRCDPMHARKMAAMLQWASASKHPIVLHYRAEAGHMATLPMDATIDELADQLAFLFRELDVAF
jgi:prolyl oligopeptidase